VAVVQERLAVEGGTPVHAGGWPTWPVWDEREEQALLTVLRSGRWGMTVGTEVGAFETSWAHFQEAKHCVAVVNGTSALEVALRAMGIVPGDEVIVPAFTFIATASAVLLAGAMPIFVDIHPATFHLDPAAVEAAITPRTRAIVPVHMGGCPADMDALLAVARGHGLQVLEDAAQAHGASWHGHRVGALGDAGTFSFQGSKNLNSGEGGAIVTNDDALYARIWSLHNVGRTLNDEWRTRGWYQHEMLGFNYRLTEFQAALLRVQMTRLDEQMARRDHAAALLDRELSGIGGIRPMTRDPRVTANAYHLYMFRYDAAMFGGRTREEFLSALRAEGIPASPGYTVPLYRSPAIIDAVAAQRSRSGRTDQPLPAELPVTERTCTSEGVWFGQSMLLASDNDLSDIPTAIQKIHRSWLGEV